MEDPLEEDPLLESLFPPRFFFFSTAEASFAFVRSRLLRLDAIYADCCCCCYRFVFVYFIGEMYFLVFSTAWRNMKLINKL